MERGVASGMAEIGAGGGGGVKPVRIMADNPALPMMIRPLVELIAR